MSVSTAIHWTICWLMGPLHWSKDFALWQWHSIFIIIHYKDLLCHHIQWELQVRGFTNGERTVIFCAVGLKAPGSLSLSLKCPISYRDGIFKAVSTGTQVFWEKCLFLLVLAFCPHIKGVLDHWKLSVWKIPTSLKILKTLFLAFKCVQGKLFVNIFLCNISVVHLLYQ